MDTLVVHDCKPWSLVEAKLTDREPYREGSVELTTVVGAL